MKIAILADTHSLLREEVIATIKDCDLILHGGDIASKEVCDRIRELGEAYFVRGNADKEWAEEIPYELETEICGYRFYMVHKKSDICQDLSSIDFVIYGHSHKYEQKTEGSITYLNPGSCGPRRFTQSVTMMVMEIDEKSRSWRVEKLDLSQILRKGSKLPSPTEERILPDSSDVSNNVLRGTGGTTVDTLGHKTGSHDITIVGREMDILIKNIIKDMNSNRPVEKIAQRNRVEKALVEEILQIYTTHPGIDVDGILNRMK